MEKECLRISEGTCKKCSACGKDCEYYKPSVSVKENHLPYGYIMWGGEVRDSLPHGKPLLYGIEAMKLLFPMEGNEHEKIWI